MVDALETLRANMAVQLENILDILESFLPIDLHCVYSVPRWVWMVLPLSFAYYKYLTWNFGFWKKMGIRGPRPWPVLGTAAPMITKGIIHHDTAMQKYGQIVGTFSGRVPSMFIFDVDILKQILVKDFDKFRNRFVIPFAQPPLDKMLTILKDDHWKHVRSILTPTFSSGKMRRMDVQIENSTKTLVDNLTAKAKSGEVFDFKELCGAFTMDAIASTAFGVQIDSHNDPNNQFVTMGKKAFQFSFASPAILIIFFFPALVEPLSKLGVSFFPKDVSTFFVNAVRSAMGARQEGGDKSKVDFIQLMINAHHDEEFISNKDNNSTEDKWKGRGLSEDEILAQGLIFFLAGFETTANTLSLLGYNLAIYPEIQEKLIQEIDQVMAKHKRLSYDSVKEMTYLDMCISETLRIYPAAVRTDRVCNEECTINGVHIPKDMHVIIPVYSLHMDPEIYPDPHKFDPERFTPEAKEARNPYYYMPFGQGPRNCIGMRLALTEIKMAAAAILMRLKFVRCEETEVPLKLNKVAMKGENGIKIKMAERNL